MTISKHYDNQEQLIEELRVNVAQESAKELLEGIEELARSVAHNQANKLAEAGHISKERVEESAFENICVFLQVLSRGFHKNHTSKSSKYGIDYFTCFVMNLIIQEPDIETALNELPEAPTEDEEAATIAERQWEENTGR